MSVSYLNSFPIDNISPITCPLSLLILILVHIINLGFVRRIFKVFSTSQSSIQYQLGLSENMKVQVGKKNQDFDLSKRQPCSNEKVDDGRLRREEVDMVMDRLGIFCHPEGVDKLPEKLGSDEVSNLFEEKEPSLDEVKEAFDVFDENRDGFIDARELQRVLCALGLKDRSEMENCRRMIRVFDENGDERIDFNEFAKFMESSFC